MHEQLATRPRGVTRRTLLKTSAAALAVSVADLALRRPQSAAATTRRPIADFLSTQGTTTVFFPPVPDFGGFFSTPSVSPILLANVDYPGHADAFFNGAFGTTIRGRVTERPLSDGRAEVSVVIQTRRALSWVIDTDDFTFVNVKRLFGYDPGEVAGGAPPVLGESHLEWTFINGAPGTPLPDLVVALIFGPPPDGFEQIDISFHATARGPLREAFGMPEGTPGRLRVVQTCPAAGCTAELVELRALRR